MSNYDDIEITEMEFFCLATGKRTVRKLISNPQSFIEKYGMDEYNKITEEVVIAEGDNNIKHILDDADDPIMGSSMIVWGICLWTLYEIKKKREQDNE